MTLNRIISLEPSITATLVALGQRHRLVGVSHYCHQLADVTGLPQFEPTWSVNAEKVAALHPDLVLAAPPFRAGAVDSLLEKQLNVFCLYPLSLTDVYAHIVWLGRLCDAAQRAAHLVSDMQLGLDRLARAAGHLPSSRAYVEIWPDPLMNATGWVKDIVDLLGGQPVPSPAGRRVSSEEVIAADPEVIILAWAGMAETEPQQVACRPGWDKIEAVRFGRIVAVEEMLLNAPGPNLVGGARQIWKALYPQATLPADV